MLDSNGRKIAGLVINREWYPDYTVESAIYEDNGAEVPVSELNKLDNDLIELYLAGLYSAA